jgi:hypothetical protein
VKNLTFTYGNILDSPAKRNSNVIHKFKVSLTKRNPDLFQPCSCHDPHCLLDLHDPHCLHGLHDPQSHQNLLYPLFLLSLST